MKRFRGLRGKQRECFEMIAIGRHLRHNPRTLKALAEKGLIQFETVQFPLDALGSLVLDVPYVPIAIHIEWCEWCAAQHKLNRAANAFYSALGPPVND